jgi:signal peptidase II
LVFWLTMLVSVAADYFSKNWIRANYALGESREILGQFLRFSYWHNSGAAFGMLQGATPYLALVSVGCVLLAVFIAPKMKGHGPWVLVALGLVAGGALGNLIDRVKFGGVTDFISLSLFSPIFNVADIAIVTGSILMGIFVLFTPGGSIEH